MKLPFAMMALAGTLAAPIALAQMPAPAPQAARPPTSMTAGLRPVTTVPPLSPSGMAPSPGPGTTSAPPTDPISAKPALSPTDGRVFEASTALPTPTIPDQPQAPAIALPNDPIEPFLLTRDAGPFMVAAKTFRGPDAERWALALVLELRNDYHLPAYVLRTRDFPMRSNIRNVPPTAQNAVRKPYLTEPEKTRTYDEAVVLVGNEKTLNDSEVLLHKVKKIKPKCLNGMPSIFHWRQGLGTALRTTNPFVPAQDLFPQKPDLLVKKINIGPHSLRYCPGHYALQVAEFGGRSTLITDVKPSKKPLGPLNSLGELITDSPLEKAYDEAEELAAKLARNPEIQKTGCQPYVYHDRTSSKVMMGAFNRPDDPAAVKLRNTLLQLAGPLSEKKTDTMIVPALILTDVEVLKASLQ